MVLVPSHRASSLLESCACTPAAPATRSTAHPITTAPTTAMRCAWRTTPPSPSLHASPATSASKHATRRTLAHLYGGLFTQVRGRGLLGSSQARSSTKFARRPVLEVLEEGYLVGASPHNISRPK